MEMEPVPVPIWAGREGGAALGSALAIAAAIILQARDGKSGEAVAVDQALPGKELLHRQLVAVAGVFQAYRPRTHGGDHLGLAADDPALGVGRRGRIERGRHPPARGRASGIEWGGGRLGLPFQWRENRGRPPKKW